MKFTFLFLILFCANYEYAQAEILSATGGPGIQGSWSSPNKQGFLATQKQKVWATIADGVLTEIYFPILDRAQTRSTQIYVKLDRNIILDERKDFTHSVSRYPQSLAFHVSSINKKHKIKIEKDFILDPARPVITMSYRIELPEGLKANVYVNHNPAADNTIGGDSLHIRAPKDQLPEMYAFQYDRRGDEPAILKQRSAQLLVINKVADEGSVGFEGVSDPLTQLSKKGAITEKFTSALGGNVSGAVGFEISGTIEFRMALAFAQEATNPILKLRSQALESLKISSVELLKQQQLEWAMYLSGLNSIGLKFEGHVLVLKALEDKTFPGAMIAAPSNIALPNGLEIKETNYEGARLRIEDYNGGLHRVWPRDSAQMALGLLAAGDTTTARNVASNLKKIQNENGYFPQNTWVDGTPSWTGFQIDQTGLPIILVSRLVEVGAINYAEYRPMVIKAADAIASSGPWVSRNNQTDYIGMGPRSLAISCQGLYEASWLERISDPARSQNYFQTCQRWKSQILEKPSLNKDYIQWFTSGILPKDDVRFKSTLIETNRGTDNEISAGLAYIKNNLGVYGPEQISQPWPTLLDDRILASLLNGENPKPHLDTLLKSVSTSGMMCEQAGSGACPLGWGHAEVLIAMRSILENKSYYIPRRLQGYSFR